MAPIFTWTTFQPVLSGEPPAWLSLLWSFRGHVLYNCGERPQFMVAPDVYCDSDSADFLAYHILVYAGLALVGCVRLLPITEAAIGVTQTLIGTVGIKQVLMNLSLEPSAVVEGGRWMVHPSYRHYGLGNQLAKAAMKLARELEYRVLFCSVGTKDKQHLILARYGFKSAPWIPLFYCEEFLDTIQVMYKDIS